MKNHFVEVLPPNHYLFIYLFTRWYNLYFIFEHFCHAWRSIHVGNEASLVWNVLACVASVSA